MRTTKKRVHFIFYFLIFIRRKCDSRYGRKFIKNIYSYFLSNELKTKKKNVGIHTGNGGPLFIRAILTVNRQVLINFSPFIDNA